MGVLRRLLSHVVLGGLAVGGLVLVDGFLAVFVGLVLYVHLLSDLVADVRSEATIRTAAADTAED
ncbi:hypothetical protein [Halogranum gelatinilyticum]|uniref:hypothetical protein n=1 Tax=Halogranum gelatinilyticum TaxID=660521 RepID=UPI000B7CBECB|nr:hypothetical protein [Halogranum gelatinilyticum]